MSKKKLSLKKVRSALDEMLAQSPPVIDVHAAAQHLADQNPLEPKPSLIERIGFRLGSKIMRLGQRMGGDIHG